MKSRARSRPFTLRIGRRSASSPGVNWELYHLAEDPGERHDVAEQYPQVALRMQQMMAESRVDHPAFKLEKHQKAK